MWTFRPLPWDYGVRNLLRRPGRSVLTLLGLGTVVFLVFLVVAFVRGLETSLAVSGDPLVVLVHSLGAGENIENSTIPGQGAGVLSASLGRVETRYRQKHVSPELYLGTEITTESVKEPAMGLVRGVTLAAPLVRRQFQLIEGAWPTTGEVLAGRLAAAKLGCNPAELVVGRTLRMEGRTWKISGRFAAAGAAFESEIWCLVDDLQQAMKRQDLSLVAVAVSESKGIADVGEFCKERVDLEWEATPELSYYASLQTHYGPVRSVAWLIVLLVSGAGAFAGLNTMYGAVVGRVRELAMLQTLGFSRRAIALCIVQEGVLLAAAGSLVAAAVALPLLNGLAVRFTMGAFTLRLDSVSLLYGLCSGLAIGVLGSLPPAWRALRMPVVEGLKAI
ncbi:MAG: FtsX-like permease family protein [Planctomycetaceae bacterium]|nr:FtsX-like permease family protein [Planctomycetaceae bacterium]